jgi:Tfp pilus assembly protein PilP
VTKQAVAKPATKPAVTPSTPKAQPVKVAAAPEKKTTPAAPKKAEEKAVKATPANEGSGEVKPAMVKEETRVSAIPKPGANKRDPFVSPIVRASGGGGPVCETGKRCLMVDQIELKGIVKSPSGFIAVVENAAKRAYFLRENDPVFNGAVIKITGDSVVFREQVTDKLGKQATREVVKKVNAPVV